MPFNPSEPQAGELIDAVQLRSQFNGLKSLIDAIPAGVTVQQLSDAIAAATANSSANSNDVAESAISPNEPPSAQDFLNLQSKLNELIVALRR